LKRAVGCDYISDLACGAPYNETAKKTLVAAMALSDSLFDQYPTAEWIGLYWYLTGNEPVSRDRQDVKNALRRLTGEKINQQDNR